MTRHLHQQLTMSDMWTVIFRHFHQLVNIEKEICTELELTLFVVEISQQANYGTAKFSTQ